MNRLLLFLLFCVSVTASAQKITILSEEDHIPLLYTPVKLTPLSNVSAEQQFLTDTAGCIHVPPQLMHVPLRIILSGIGYETLTDTTQLDDNKIYILKTKREQLNEVVITGQYAPNSTEKAVHQVKLIDRKKIDQMAAQNLRDVLTNEMNIRLSQDNVLGSSMSLQGISGQNVKILIDGIPVTGRLNGNIDVSQINMNNVSKIEIVEGPMSVNYGSDALAGTINVITKKTQQEPLAVSLNSYYESIGQYNFSGRIGLRNTRNSVSLSGGRNYFDGWRTTDEPFRIEKKSFADSSRFMNWKPKEQYFATFNYVRFLPFKKGDLKLGYTADYFNEAILNRGMPRQPYFENAFDDQYQTRRVTNSADLKGALNKNYYLNILAAYTHYQRIKNTYFKDLTTLQQGLTENPGDQDTSTFNTITTRGSISTTGFSKFNYEAGYDINHEKSFGIRIKDGTQQLGDYAVFGSGEYKPVDAFTIRPGIRFIYNTSYKAPVVPSIHIRYELTKNQVFRISYARGFRAPSLKELYFYFVDINHNIIGNENLKAERSHNVNLSLTSTNRYNRMAFKTEGSAFYNDIEQMITLALISGTQYTYFNVDRFRTMGLQLQTQLHVDQLTFTLGGACIGRYNQLAAQSQTEKYMFSPEAKCNLVYNWEKPRLTFACFYKYTGSLPSYLVNAQNEINKTIMQDYHTADVSISKRMWKKRISISTGIKNLLNVTTVTGYSSGDAHASSENTVNIGMGRTYFIKLDFNFTSTP